METIVVKVRRYGNLVAQLIVNKTSNSRYHLDTPDSFP